MTNPKMINQYFARMQRYKKVQCNLCCSFRTKNKRDNEKKRRILRREEVGVYYAGTGSVDFIFLQHAQNVRRNLDVSPNGTYDRTITIAIRVLPTDLILSHSPLIENDFPTFVLQTLKVLIFSKFEKRMGFGRKREKVVFELWAS